MPIHSHFNHLLDNGVGPTAIVGHEPVASSPMMVTPPDADHLLTVQNPARLLCIDYCYLPIAFTPPFIKMSCW